MTMSNLDRSRRKLQRVERTIEAQKIYIRRLGDPEKKARAEQNLAALNDMRDDIKRLHNWHSAQAANRHSVA